MIPTPPYLYTLLPPSNLRQNYHRRSLLLCENRHLIAYAIKFVKKSVCNLHKIDKTSKTNDILLTICKYYSILIIIFIKIYYIFVVGNQHAAKTAEKHTLYPTIVNQLVTFCRLNVKKLSKKKK